MSKNQENLHHIAATVYLFQEPTPMKQFKITLKLSQLFCTILDKLKQYFDQFANR
jgi:hypothetical protein